MPNHGVGQSYKEKGIPLHRKSGRTRNSSLKCSNVVPNRATFEYSSSVSFIRRKSANRATR